MAGSPQKNWPASWNYILIVYSPNPNLLLYRHIYSVGPILP
jgi:hypothetical protein